MTEDDIRLAMELFGGKGYKDPLNKYNRSREIPPAPTGRRSALDAARFPKVGRGTEVYGIEDELQESERKSREATIAGLDPLEQLQAIGEGGRAVGQGLVAGVLQPFAQVMGVPADKFFNAAIDFPETEGGKAYARKGADAALGFFDAMSESPLGPVLSKIPMSPYSPASAQAIDTGLMAAGKGLKLAGQQAKQAGRQTLEAGKDLAQAARAEFATPPTGAVQLQTQQATRNPLGMYSQAEQVALNLAQEKGTGNQFLAQISKAPGVKPAELEWTGLADFLKSKGDKPVTKAEIQQHLDANRVQVQEVQLSGTVPYNRVRTVEDQIPEGFHYEEVLDRDGEPTGMMRIYDSDGDLVSESSDPEQLMRRAGLKYEETEPDAKYGEWQLPGGYNYREVLLTLPQKVEKGFTTPNGAFFSEADLENPVVRSTAEKIGLSPAFRNVGTVYESPHFDQPNVLAHMRLNDRLDADGNRVLFVEEIQSDWGQQGREKGFAIKETPWDDPEYKAARARSTELLNEYNRNNDDLIRQNEIRPLLDEARRLEHSFLGKRGAPPAPFVQNTEDWVNLSLKRLITDAVNNGYKKVAFINGDQSAARYDLSKHVDELFYMPKSNTLVATKNGQEAFNQRVPADKLADYIGKDAAEKLLVAPGPGPQNLSGSSIRKLSGVDLKVGGEGMKKFYDQIVPATANKLLKKLGGGKLEPLKIGDNEQLGFTITPEMVELVKKQGLPMFAGGGAITMAKGGEAELDNYALAEAEMQQEIEDALAYEKLNRLLRETEAKLREGLITPEEAVPLMGGLNAYEIARLYGLPTDDYVRPQLSSDNPEQHYDLMLSPEKLSHMARRHRDYDRRMKQHEYGPDSEEVEVNLAIGGGAFKGMKQGLQRAAKGPGKTEDPAKKASKAQRREVRVQKNLEAYMGSKEKPKTYYHATQAPEDFEAFDLEKRPTKRSAAAVFVTPSTNWANDWAVDELADMDLLEKVDTPKPRIMPVITRAKNTFDYDDLGHVTQVMNQADLPPGLDRQHIADQISIGNWNFIEDRNIQKAIKDLGFDSFFVKEKGVKNMGIFNPGDVKALFNRGSYDPTTADISKADGGRISADDIRQKLKNAFNFAGGGGVGLRGAMRGLEAVQSGADKAKPAVSRIDMSYKDVTKRVPELTEAAKKVEAGEMNAEEYAGLVGEVKPVEPYAFVPQPASAEDAMRALTENKRPMFGKTGELKPGERADLRLDIPAYKDHGVWINSIHRASGPTVYGSVSSVKNATMIGAPEKALKVATGQTPKSPFAVIRGEWNPVSEEEAVAKAQLYMQSPEWVQVGYDPERAGYFYDRKTRKPVTAAEEVLQIGPLVLAKKPKFSDVKDQKFAEGGATSNTLLERLRRYKVGGAVSGAQKGLKAVSKSTKSAKPAKATEPAKTESVIEDWQWRPNEQVTAEVGLKEVPDYIQGGYGEFMKGQQKRAQAGQMGVRDLIKAYTITRSSVNRSGLPRDTATKTGMKIPQTDGLVRPEGAFAEWLGSKQGQNYLKAADRGEIDEKAIADLQTKFAPFGMASVLADDMRWAVKNAPTLASNLSQTIIGDPQTYRSVSQQLQGIGPAKSGFLGSLVGRGDFPTLDARQLRLHTGAGGAEASKFMRRRGGLGGEQAVGRLAGRQEEMGLDIDPSLNPFYQHLTHHAVWDKVADEQTTHDDLVRAMMGYKDGGEVKLSRGGGDLLGRMEKGLRAAQKGTEKKAKKDKPPPKFEPAPAIPKEQIRSMAERIAQQTTGEFVRQNPKTTQNPEGLSKVQFERTKAVKPNIKYNVPQKDAPVVDIEKYKDYLLVGVPGDITPGGVIRTDPVDLKPRATQELLGIDDVEFETPVGMYGGSRYGQESVFPEGLEAFWASGLSPARALQNSITRFSEAEGGRPVLGMFSKMSRPASSFSGHLMEGLLEYQHPERLPKAKIRELNEIVRRGTPSKQFPNFVGFEDPEKMRVQAMQDGKLRTHINNVLTMSTLNKQLGLDPKKGLRSGLDVSAAMTIPELSGLEVGASGYSLGRMVPGADLRLSAHPTYSQDISGEFLGRTPYHIPYELAYPRTAHFVRENIPRGELFNTMKGTGMKEQIDQQYIDQIKLYQQYMKELTGRKKGGLATIKKAKVKNGN